MRVWFRGFTGQKERAGQQPHMLVGLWGGELPLSQVGPELEDAPEATPRTWWAWLCNLGPLGPQGHSTGEDDTRAL